MTTTTRQVHTKDFVLGPGQRTLRVSVTDGGEAGALVVADGFGEGGTFNRPPHFGPPLVLPVDALPKLRAALAELEELLP